ncbi:DNA polymerase III subunit alpha [Portibacter marinus]|uniref:DNA polymerase III subunit alpha n=1 Tax=Portibacter marinus TaxID=2898660 RepID=UPI001F3A5CA0|nr:DNA polymerase III subunit alpha [Portibacter marinus]
MYLNCHSQYSLRYGTFSVKELVLKAKMEGFEALALTDINNTTGVYDFILECREVGIKPIIGIDFRTKNHQHFVGLAQDREGFREMNELLSAVNRGEQKLPDIAPDWNHCFVIYPFGHEPEKLRSFEFIGVSGNQLNRFRQSQWYKHQDRVAILHPVTHKSIDHFGLHAVLRAIDNNILLSDLKPKDAGKRSDVMLPMNGILGQFDHFPEIIKTTRKLVDQCNFTFDFSTLKNKKTYTNTRYNDKVLLTNLALEGMVRRYGKNNKEAKSRVLHEIEIIDKLEFSGYFLITWDIVKYSMTSGFYHVGRGSGANSIVAYCLFITNICPMDLNLYFERFLNPARKSPPDFDIDWSWRTRDHILQYIFTRFDSDRTAFVATIGTFKHRSTFREIGKVFGLAKEELDTLAKNPRSHHGKTQLVRKIHTYANQLQGFPNQRSLHACGVIISEEPLTYYAAMDMPPKGFQTTQFDMYIAEEIGFEKLDILSQRGIGHINEAVDIIRENKGEEVKIERFHDFKNDPELNKRLAMGQTLGCFYIESPAMRGLLRRLRCSDYITLVAASSVIRPGVAKSGMMREYVFRHNNPDKFEYFHEVFKEQLSETYGVMVYQEDVMKIAHAFAGLDMSHADILRRGMSGKTRSKKEFLRVKEAYFRNCQERGYPEELTNEVYRQIESFAGYSFCKAHSASYSVESYQSLYLKTYYPIEFMVAVINNFGGFYRTEVYIHEARMAGAKICPPCVNRSDVYTSVQGESITLGFIHLKSVDADTQLAIVEERTQNGHYKDLFDFIERVPIGLETIQTLIFAGAFLFTGKSKSKLVIEARMILTDYKVDHDNQRLFSISSPEYSLPELPHSYVEDAYDELEIFGFPVSCSPFDLLKTEYRGSHFAKDLPRLNGQYVKMVGYLISRKNVPTTQGNMNFGTWIDVNGGYYDTTHFAKCLERFPFEGGGCYLLYGKVDVDFSFPNIIIERMAKLPFKVDPRYEDHETKKFDQQARFREDFSNTWRAPYPSEQEIGLPRKAMPIKKPEK